jgi:hypothetical protein
MSKITDKLSSGDDNELPTGAVRRIKIPTTSKLFYFAALNILYSLFTSIRLRKKTQKQGGEYLQSSTVTHTHTTINAVIPMSSAL